MDLDREPDLELPDSLVDGLRGAFTPADEPPRGADQAILRASRNQAAAIRTSRRGGRPWWIGAVAAAAALVLFVGLRVLNTDHPAELADLGPADDVTVLDAFRLARLLRDDTAELGARWDVDANGRVNADDVDRLLDRAVSLGGV